MFLGLDFGTSGIKAVLVDEQGAVLGQNAATLTVSRPHDLWSEQAPDAWISAMDEAVLGLDAALRARVQGIGLAGQMHGATLLGADDKPLRPAILWNDGRSHAECLEIEAAEPDSRAITGNIVMPGFTAPKLAWVRKHEPEIFAATRSVLARNTNTLFSHLGMDAYREQVKSSHAAIDSAVFTTGVMEAMRAFFKHNRELFERADKVVGEISTMMLAMYRKFGGEFGLKLAAPAQFSMQRYLREIDRVEASFDKRFGAMSMITEYKRGLATRFFGVVASRIQTAFEVANRDAEAWLKAVMNPLELQIKERQQQLRRRLDSIKRIHEATDTLEDRVQELRESEKAMTGQVIALDHLRQEIETMLAQEMMTAVDGATGFDLSL